MFHNFTIWTLFNYHWWEFWYYNWWMIYGEPWWQWYGWHVIFGGPIIALIACKLILPRQVWGLISALVFGFLPYTAMVGGVSWASLTYVPLIPLGGWEGWTAWAIAGIPISLFMNHLRVIRKRMATHTRQHYAKVLNAYHTERKKLIEEFNPDVVYYDREDLTAYRENIAWFEGDGPKETWFYFSSRRKQKRAYQHARGDYPTLDAHLAAFKTHLTERREQWRQFAPVGAKFLNDYKPLLVKFKPGTPGVEWLSEADHRYATNYLAHHLRWSGEFGAVCKKCENGLVLNKKRWQWEECECMATFRAKMRQATDVAVLKMISCTAEHLPATMYDFIHAEMDRLGELVGEDTPVDALVKEADKLLTQQFIDHHRRAGNVILGYPESIPGVYDATYSLPVVTTPEEMTRHGYLRGKTGAGKTTAMQYRLTQMFHLPRRGTVTVSSERRLFQHQLLPYLPRERYHDVLYVNPDDDTGEVMGTNPLILRKGENYRKKRQHLAVTFNRALGPFGVAMLPLFVNGIGALLLRPNSSILDFDSLLDVHNDALRRELIRSSELSDNIRQFWQRYEDRTYYHNTAVAVRNRLDAFFEEPLRTFFTTDAIDWDTELNSTAHARHIFIDTSDMAIGSDEARITVELILAQILYTATRRDLANPHLVPYSMFIDEFWQYTNADPKTWEGIFNQARKFLFDLTPAHQVTEGIPKDVIGLILNNVGTITAGQLARGDAGLFAGELQFKDREGKLRPDIFMNLNPGHMGVMTPNNRIGTPIYIPQEQLVPRTPDYDFDELVAFSKKTHGKKPEVQHVLIEDEPMIEVKKPEPKKRGSGRPSKKAPVVPPKEEWHEELL